MLHQKLDNFFYWHLQESVVEEARLETAELSCVLMLWITHPFYLVLKVTEEDHK